MGYNKDITYLKYINMSINTPNFTPHGKQTDSQDFVDLLKKIGGDDTLNIQDSANVDKALTLHDNIQDHIKKSYAELSAEMLKKGFTINSAADYSMIKKIVAKTHPEWKMPEFNAFQDSKLFGSGSNQLSKFSLSLENKIITVHAYDAHEGLGSQHGYFNTADGKYIEDESFFNNDAFGNNNEFSIKDADLTVKDAPFNPQHKQDPDYEYDMVPTVRQKPANELPEIESPPKINIPGLTTQPDDSELPNLVELPPKTEHTVESGDTLWKIVKDHYKLTDKKIIAQTVNAVVDAQDSGRMATRLGKDTLPVQFKDGIKGDRLYVGDVIKLPPTNALTTIPKSATGPR
ncbi:LysM peptidoglycan-binding domain-containing protein [Candidatus Gracilibacteria bacterium]|nr:LysM peptidoglycan-binding domain-containing protein [Candidatus Gracilibacteria bacterium]